jgi:N-carbamoyl-L-amino-acid hydrolase
MNFDVSTDRLREDIETSGAFGSVEVDDPEARGRTNLTGSDANAAAREYLRERMEAAGLDVSVDAVGNVSGTWSPPSADPTAEPVVAGSHLDSVPEGGIFDGPLGVYGALEAVRALQDAGADPERPVTVVSFTEEEGATFGEGLLGSSVAAGRTDIPAALSRTDDRGRTLEDALEAIGFRGEGTLDAASWDAFVELHVEQDTVLEERQSDDDTGGPPGPVGVVTTITGITHCEARIVGEADHAGTTAMPDRTDALAAAAEVILDVEAVAEDIVAARSETAVGTVGSLDVRPNATNVVPGEVELGIDIRDVEYESMESMVQAAQRSLDLVASDRGVETTFERPFDIRPEPMCSRIVDAAHDAGRAAGIETHALHSGAAHDAMEIATATDAGMLFAPSRDGISHNPREWTDWADCRAATRVLAGTIADLAGVA